MVSKLLWVVCLLGYGHIAPKTSTGMVVTIFYAIIGIPLTLLTIANLGRMLATAFRFLYRNVFSIVCSCCKRPPQPETLPLNASTSGPDLGTVCVATSVSGKKYPSEFFCHFLSNF